MIHTFLLSLLLTTKIFMVILPFLPAYHDIIDQGIKDYKEGRDDDNINPW